MFYIPGPLVEPISKVESGNLFVSVDSSEELVLLKSLRDELRSSPLLKAILIEKLQNKKE
jgi:hypothetical protein